MAEHPNATLVRALIEHMNDGDEDAIAAALADDIVWHEIGSSEPVRGLAALAARQTDRSFAIDVAVHDVVANDDHAVALVDAHATRDGRTLDYRTAEIVHIRDGKITERWAFSDDTARIAAFFA